MSIALLPEALRNILEDLERFPGIGPRSAQRIAFSLLNESPDFFVKLQEDIAQLAKGIAKCQTCGMLTDGVKCKICLDEKREKNVLCVVESSLDIIAIERIGEYRGVFHVLGGLLSPLDHVGPEDIGIDLLINRLVQEKPSEIILALNPSTEGETTALFIKKIVSQNNLEITVTRLAQGLPTGAALEYADDLTISHAFSGRRTLTR
jgi:recombination protein RecR